VLSVDRRDQDADGDAALAGAATDDVALERLAARLLALGPRVLLLGEPGTGKSTLARRLGAHLHALGRTPECIGADPGSPGFGVPGAVCLGRWHDGGWRLAGVEALCTLDAGRFRLPLVTGVRRLAAAVEPQRPLLLDGPGVVRGVAAAELIPALVEAAAIQVLIVLGRARRQPLVDATLLALGLRTITIDAAGAARRPGKAARARERTRLWDAYLADAPVHHLDLERIAVLGTPPPLEATAQWPGRQAALLRHDGTTAALGEVVAQDGGRLDLRCQELPVLPTRLLVRDARREPGGRLGSAGPDAADAVRYAPPADVLPGAASASGPRPVVRAGPATAALVNGVLGDPLLHVRLHHQRRSLLFDLGEAGRLPARVAHQVSDVFLSHAHMDHVAGFVWLLRSRMGEFPALRVFGPPGIARNLQGMLDAFLWDRIERRGPRFEVAELDGEQLERWALQAGLAPQPLVASTTTGGLLVDEPELRVRADFLDHGHGTRVLAYALDTPMTLKVRKERLQASGLAPGPWLTTLKRAAAAGAADAAVLLPNGREVAAGELAGDLLLQAPGLTLAYATDLADTPRNRDVLARLATGAHTLFCEASFREADAPQAARTGHLTTRACGEIARRAAVQRLVPFHFSRRYEDDLAPVYDEIRSAFPRTVTPALRDRGD
jgi:ribonuclease BN (tRNA processing enzyme)